MKIALVSAYDFPYPGGVTTHICRLEENFRRQGHDVRIIAASSQPEAAAARNALVIGRPTSVRSAGSIARITLSLRLSGRVKRLLQQEGFDVVHLHEPLVPALPITMLRFSNTVNVGTFHAYTGSTLSSNNLGYYYGRRILRRWFRRLHGKIAVSRPAWEFVSQYFPGYYHIIPNGIDYERFARPALPLPELDDGKLNILFVGRAEKRKGLHYLLRAYAYVRQEFPNARLVVVGPETGSMGRYKEWVLEKGLEGVYFAGYVSDTDLPRYYQSAHVFCSPSTGGESFGIVLLEAMAAGRAVVATNIEGYKEVVTHGSEGLLLEPKKVERLAMALVHVLADASLREFMGERGRQRAAEFSWARVAQRVLSYYESLLDEYGADAKLLSADDEIDFDGMEPRDFAGLG
ncbi:MAG: glycosyltransferase family 1 protein [Chloroflexota bacterium]|nr:MAG: glycosyltransferase family 1 protein [Chloroflexota bacterium]